MLRSRFTRTAVLKIISKGVKMKKFELKGNPYKANLHCHTTVSDGKLTPEEIKKIYMAEGYSIVAYTDHEVLIDHSDLCDKDFLALNGYEIGVSDNSSQRCCHLCFVAKDQKNLTQVCYNNGYVWGNAASYKPLLKFDCDDYGRVYSGEGISDMIAKGRNGGFFVTYNHPTWSLENYPQYSAYEGMDAMEIFNTGCYVEGYNEYNDHAYDDLLRQGKRVFCIAADDNHNRDATPPLYRDSFGGWIVIFADKLEYGEIVNALEAGRFYASSGPEITGFYVEGNEVHIKTSRPNRIRLITGRGYCAQKSDATEAVFKITPEDIYFRIDIIDENGNHANTNAIFVDEIFG